MITEKQYQYIKTKLYKWNIYDEDIKQLTKKEASNIIQRNIIEHRPLLQWYCTQINNLKYAKKFEFTKCIKNMVSDRYYLNKRLLEESIGCKLEYTPFLGDKENE